MSTDPTEHEISANLVLLALDGPRGPEVASALIHKWLLGDAKDVPPEQTTAIVARWPYAAQIQDLVGQVERLSVLEHLDLQSQGLNPMSDAHAMAQVHARRFQIMEQVREYLRKTIKDENARKALGLEPRKKRATP